MKQLLRQLILVLACALISLSTLSGQKRKKKEAPEGYTFTIEKSIGVTPVKDQHRSGTCWCFASTSFIEAELLREGKGEFDLSEMFFVRKAYELKADKYVRMHGKINFGAGGLVLDVMHIWDNYGMVPEQVYHGMAQGDSLPVHGELDAVLRGYVDQVIRNRNKSLTPVWKDGLNGILDAYFGKLPGEFEYEGEKYTPLSFSDQLGLDPGDYVAIGSYTHQPFYESFLLEIPDNWIWGSILNVPLDEMMQVLDHAIETGYSVCWDADTGEKGFDWDEGLALIPSTEIGDLTGLERARWDELPEDDQKDLFYDFSTPKKEREISQELRQKWFDNYQTTDDHLMHITGTAKDQDGHRFYLVKNSWGTGKHIYKGYFYSSESYMRAKTVFFLVHRDAVPAAIAAKLGL